MGIPSYFAHFVRQHRKIIKPINKLNKQINNLYLDCNGFIYEGVAHFVSEEVLIKYVCDKLIYYINLLKPNKKVFIAFDGVAPVAKLNQQRKRRYLSWFQTEYMKNHNIETHSLWNTAAITPGTLFMTALEIAIKKRFQRAKEFGLEQFIISCADEVGEGEHKIYEYIRNEPSYHYKTTTVIYGLDADLIMLTLNHLHISNQLYLFRETPAFIKSIDNTLNPNELYLLDIPEFGKNIILDLFTNHQKSEYIINDYIFIFFLLGNDFLPHFPSLNIRTNGIEILLNAYKTAICEKNLCLIDNGKIIWKNVGLLIKSFCKDEQTFIKNECLEKINVSSARRKYNNNKLFEDKIINIPSSDRAVELYINPDEVGWESRYYQSLFDIRIDDERRKEICTNYLEGLEWTFKYYSTGCVDWRWTYKYHYPPLFVDLIKYVPYYDKEYFSCTHKSYAVSPAVQLSYVLPKQNLYLIPNVNGEIINNILELNKNTDKCEFQWAFCKYFWEAHVKFPDIDIEKLVSLLQ